MDVKQLAEAAQRCGLIRRFYEQARAHLRCARQVPQAAFGQLILAVEQRSYARRERAALAAFLAEATKEGK